LVGRVVDAHLDAEAKEVAEVFEEGVVVDRVASGDLRAKVGWCPISWWKGTGST